MLKEAQCKKLSVLSRVLRVEILLLIDIEPDYFHTNSFSSGSVSDLASLSLLKECERIDCIVSVSKVRL